jgi:hypothetical protein
VSYAHQVIAKKNQKAGDGRQLKVPSDDN